MVICLERDADLHMAQLMPLPLTVSCFSKIQIGFTFLVLAHPGSPGQKAIKRVCVCAGMTAKVHTSIVSCRNLKIPFVETIHSVSCIPQTGNKTPAAIGYIFRPYASSQMNSFPQSIYSCGISTIPEILLHSSRSRVYVHKSKCFITAYN